MFNTSERQLWQKPRSWQTNPSYHECNLLLQEAETKFSDLQKTLLTTAAQIRSQFELDNFANLWQKKMYGSDNLSNLERIWLTARPEGIYPSHTLYHVTSSCSLESMCAGLAIYPPNLHRQHAIQTHRGFALSAMSILLESFGIGMGSKDSIVWLGTKVDNEQFALENMVAEMGEQVDREIIDILFESTQQSDFTVYNPKSELLEICQAIAHGQKPEDDPDLKLYIEEFMHRIFNVTLIREGWYLALKSALLGNKLLINNDSPYDFIQNILPAALCIYLKDRKASKKSSQASQAVILEVNSDKLFKEVLEIGPYPFVPGRDPDEIVAAPFLSMRSVRKVYANNPDALTDKVREELNRKGIQLESIDVLPKSAYLDPNLPARIDPTQVNPEKPLAQLRYKGNSQIKWYERLNSGLMVPCFTRTLHLSETDQLFQIFGNDVLSTNAEHTNWPLVKKNIRWQLINNILPGVYNW